MATALTLKVLDTQAVDLAFIMPIYPMLDCRMETPSAKEMIESHCWKCCCHGFSCCCHGLCCCHGFCCCCQGLCCYCHQRPSCNSPRGKFLPWASSCTLHHVPSFSPRIASLLNQNSRSLLRARGRKFGRDDSTHFRASLRSRK